MRFLVCMLLIAGGLASLCQPPPEKRAYVTILADSQDCVLKVRVLRKSLRKFAFHADLVVIVPEEILTLELSTLLRQEGFRIHTVDKNALRDIKPSHLHQVLPLWAFELFEYDRVVYLDPFSLVIENLDNIFSCPGYCASTVSKFGPVVLQPLKDTHAYLLQLVKSGKHDILMELQWFYNLKSCPAFTDIGSSLTSVCQQSDYKSSSLSTCRQLPLSLGVPSSYFSSSSLTTQLVCPSCGFDKPRLIIYPNNEPSYEAFLFTEKAIRWRWHDLRSGIPVSQSEALTAFGSFVPPLFALLVVLWSHRKASVAGSFSGGGTSGGDDRDYDAPSVSIQGLIATCPRDKSFSLKCLCQGLLMLVVASAWYRVSRALGATMVVFAWEPTTSAAVTFVWMNLGLLMGLQIIDVLHLSGNRVRTGITYITVLLVLFFTIRFLLPSPQLHFPVFMLLFSLQLCRVYLTAYGTSGVLRERGLARSQSFVDSGGEKASLVRSASLSEISSALASQTATTPLVQKEDISILLCMSLCYYLATGIALYLPLPDSTKSFVIRLIAFLHATGVVMLYISVATGHAGWVSNPAGRAKALSMICQFNPLRGNIKESIDHKCSLFQRIVSIAWGVLKHPVVIILVFLATVCVYIFYVLFLQRIPVMPQTHPYFCLLQKDMFVNPIGSISTMCGASEAMSLYDTGAYSETFSQHYYCMEAAPSPHTLKRKKESDAESDLSAFIQNAFASDKGSISLVIKESPSNDQNMTRKHIRRKKNKSLKDKTGDTKFLNIRRGTSLSCSADTEFVFITVLPNQLADDRGYCIYSPRHGKFLSSGDKPSDDCGSKEMWHIIPSHTATHWWTKIEIIFSLLRYRFVFSYPLISCGFLAAMVLVCRMRSVATNYSLKGALSLSISMITILLTHVFIVTVIYGTDRYSENRNMISHRIQVFQGAMGLPTGPQFLRLLVTHPEQCPETIWLLSLCTYSCGTAMMVLFLYWGVFDGITFGSSSSSKRKHTSVSLDEFQSVSTDEGDSSKRTLLRKISSADISSPGGSVSSTLEISTLEEDEDILIPSSTHANYTPLAVVISYVIGALLMVTFVSLIFPFHDLGTTKDGKPPCSMFEHRFHLMGYGHEYVQVVLIMANILCHLATLNTFTGKVYRLASFVLGLMTYILVWLTVECSYLTFAINVVATLLAWEYAVPKLAPFYEKTIYG